MMPLGEFGAPPDRSDLPRLHERAPRRVLRAARPGAAARPGRRARRAHLGVHPPRRPSVRRQPRVPARRDRLRPRHRRTMAPALPIAYRDGPLDPELLRGRSAWPAPAQVAEQELRRRLGLDGRRRRATRQLPSSTGTRATVDARVARRRRRIALELRGRAGRPAAPDQLPRRRARGAAPLAGDGKGVGGAAPAAAGVNRELLVEAAERWGTPLYVTDLDRRRRQRPRLARCAAAGALVAYAVKANPDPALLRGWPTTASGSRSSGRSSWRSPCGPALAPDGSWSTASARPMRDLAAAAAHRRAGQRRVARRARGAARDRCSADRRARQPGASTPRRIRTSPPGRPARSSGSRSTSCRRRRSRRSGARVIGAHIGSAIDDAGAVRPAGRPAARRWRDAHRHRARRPRRRLRRCPRRVGRRRCARSSAVSGVIVEPGRSVVASAGWLLTRVVRVQARGHLVADAGMTELIRPMLYGARHPVSRCSRRGRAIERSRRGRCPVRCARRGTSWPRTSISGLRAGEGALLAIGEAGAYGAGDGVELQRAASPGAGRDRGRRASPQPASRDARGSSWAGTPSPRPARIRGRP